MTEWKKKTFYIVESKIAVIIPYSRQGNRIFFVYPVYYLQLFFILHNMLKIISAAKCIQNCEITFWNFHPKFLMYSHCFPQIYFDRYLYICLRKPINNYKTHFQQSLSINNNVFISFTCMNLSIFHNLSSVYYYDFTEYSIQLKLTVYHFL